MSYYSTIHGRINAKTEGGARVLDRLFDSWTQEENAQYGALVHLEDRRLVRSLREDRCEDHRVPCEGPVGGREAGRLPRALLVVRPRPSG